MKIKIIITCLGLLSFSGIALAMTELLPNPYLADNSFSLDCENDNQIVYWTGEGLAVYGGSMCGEQYLGTPETEIYDNEIYCLLNRAWDSMGCSTPENTSMTQVWLMEFPMETICETTIEECEIDPELVGSVVVVDLMASYNVFPMDNFAQNSLAYTGNLFSGISPLLYLVVGLPLGFWLITKVLRLFPVGIKNKRK